MASGEGNDLGESCVECLSKFMPSQNYKQKYSGPNFRRLWVVLLQDKTRARVWKTI